MPRTRKTSVASRTATRKQGKRHLTHPDEAHNASSTPSASRPASKTACLVELLAQPNGATITELCEATGWQQHSVRGAMAGTLRRKGHVVTSLKQEGERRYRIAQVAP